MCFSCIICKSTIRESVTNSENIWIMRDMKLCYRCTVERDHRTLACATNTKLYAAMPGMSNLQFISCFITPNWKHVAGEWRQGWLTRSITIGTRLRPSLQRAGKTLVYSQQYTSHQRRQLLLLFHPYDQHSCTQSHLHLLHSTAYSLGLSVLFWRHAT